MSAAFGQQIKQADIDDAFYTGPGESIVAATLMQLNAAPGDPVKGKPFFPFQELFGPYTAAKPGQNQPDQQRWADYARHDWSVRQLPAISVYEADTEELTSPNGWINGTINLMIHWPPSQRRSDYSRVPSAFKGAMQNFFQSAMVDDMLDELYWVRRPMKVPGLNEYGKSMTWAPNVEGIIDGNYVPVTLIGVKYRLDLRAWYRELEFQNRTRKTPFQTPLADLTTIAGEYDGDTNAGPNPQVVIPDKFGVTNP